MTCLSEYKKKTKKLADRFTDTLTYRRFNVHEYMSLTVPIILGEALLHVPGENHRPVTNYGQTLSHNVVSSSLSKKLP